MLLHLAMMLSKVSGWGLPSDLVKDLIKAYDSSHESAISGEVDGGARDRRQLWPHGQPMASRCDGWSVPARILPRLTVPMPSCLRFMPRRTPLPRLFVRSDTSFSCDSSCDSHYACDNDDDDGSIRYCPSSCDSGCDTFASCDSSCNTGCSGCPSGKYSAASTSLVAPRAVAEPPDQPTPEHRAAAPAPQAFAPPRAITHQPTVHACARRDGDARLQF